MLILAQIRTSPIAISLTTKALTREESEPNIQMENWSLVEIILILFCLLKDLYYIAWEQKSNLRKIQYEDLKNQCICPTVTFYLIAIYLNNALFHKWIWIKAQTWLISILSTDITMFINKTVELTQMCYQAMKGTM